MPLEQHGGGGDLVMPLAHNKDTTTHWERAGFTAMDENSSVLPLSDASMERGPGGEVYFRRS
jgi:hypothetical protein